MRRRGPRLRIGLAVLAVGAAAGWWWQSARPRTLTVRIFPDYAYRRRSDWKLLLQSRMAQVARIYSSQTGVRWKLAGIETEDPIDGASGSMDARRAAVAGNPSYRAYQADVLLIVTGIQEGARTGSVAPFSHVALVVDFPDRSESLNVLTTAHELAHLFGVPNEAGSGLMSPTPAGSRFSRRAAALIDSVRGFPFREGAAAIGGVWEPRLVRALSAANQGLIPNPRSLAWQVLATSESIDGLYDPAVRHLREASREDPKSSAVRIQLAAALVHDTDPDAAIAILREGVKLDPRNSQVHAMLAAVLASSHREEAAEEYQAAIRLDPTNPGLYEALGVLLHAGGRIDAAIAAFQEAARLEPQSSRIRSELAGAQAAKTQALADAARLRAAAEAARADSNAWYRLGLAEGRAGNYDAAAKAFNRAIDLDPGAGAPHVSLAIVYYIRGAYTDAAAETARARALGSQPPADFAAAIQRHTAH